MKPRVLASAAGIPIDSYRKYEGDSAVPGGLALAGLARAGVRVQWLLTGGEPPKVEQPAAAYIVSATEARRVIAGLSKEIGHDPGSDWTTLLIALMADHGLRPSGVREVLLHLSTFQQAKPTGRDVAA